MRTVTIHPMEASPHGTLSRILLDNQPLCYSIELPWLQNTPTYSCIPAGEYRCIWHRSPKYGWVYLVTDVPDRSWILIHPGNFAGDRRQGFKTHSYGCILLGRTYGRLKTKKGMQRSVLVSRPTVRRFFDEMGQEDFTLCVKDRLEINHD